MSYIAPGWAQKPDSSHEWSLLEIKGGVQVGSYPLHIQACTVLGRAADQVDIALHHESTSRQHARIAFDSGGFPWLRDLGSTHGTTCNKRKLPPIAVGKMERNDQGKGSRGIMIFPGDILQFGASTRLFCVEGPSECERGAYQARQKQLEQKRQEEVGIEAMRNDESEVYIAPESVKKVVPVDAEVPQKLQKTLERLNAAKYKLQNLQTEDDRIRRKGELSDGQEKQLQRNAEREKVLMESIDALETELYDKLYPEQAGKEVSAHSGQQGPEIDEDEFFDRTKRLDKSVVEDGESETTLTEKWKRLQAQQNQRRFVSLASAKTKVDSLSAQHSDLEATGDSEEAFFLQNDLQLAKEELDKLSKAINESEANLAEIERFLRVVNPKLKFDRISGYIGSGDPNEKIASGQSMAPPSPSQQSHLMLPPPSQTFVVQPESQSTREPFAMLPPAPKRVAPTSPRDDTLERVLPDATMPPPKRNRAVGPVMPPPHNAVSTMDGNRPSGPAKDHRRAKVQQGTMAFISSMNKTEKIVESIPSLPKEAPSEASTNLILDPKADTWRVPTGQDGSGMTKLNAKFAGRY